VTFLFTDVEGSTRLLESAPREFEAALAASRRAIRTACRKGHEVDTQGDSFFFAFERAEEAVTAARDAQERLSELPLRVRMGIHTGSVRLSGEGYVGLEVNRAARIAAAAHGGQVLLSQTTRDLVPAADIVDLGEHRLKDLSLPLRLFQLGRDVFPAPLTLENRPMNLPAQGWPLVGRERELEELRHLLLRNPGAVVTVTGPAGAGKTRLALQLAADLVDRFPGGVWYVALESVRDPDRVPAAVAGTLGVGEAEVARELEAKRPLLILDNLEQLLAAGVVVAALARENGATVLATSRAPLRVAGEHEYPLGPLDVEPAVELFLERARAVRPDFAPGNGTLTELVQRLDGLPLAIELAAARVRLLSPDAILSHLDDRFVLLTGGRRDSPARQRTLIGAIEWSYDLLSEDERLLFARLSCFVGGFDLEAAQQVCDAGLDDLEGLVENSLLRVEQDRFSMLESIHEYASERLEALGRAKETRLRHAEYYADLARQARDEMRNGCWLDRWMAWGGREADNLRTAIDTFRDAGEIEQAARTTLGLVAYLNSRGLLIEACELLDALLPELDSLDEQLRAEVNQARAQVLWARGDAAGCRALCEDLLRRARSLGDAHLEAVAANGLGLASLREGDYDQAEDWFAQYERYARAAEPALVPFAVNNRAVMALVRGCPGVTRELLEEQLGSGIGHGLLEHNVALSHLAEGNRSSALEWFGRSLGNAQAAQHEGILVYGLHGLAAAYVDSNPGLAAMLRGCALALARRLGVEIEEPDATFARSTDRSLDAELGPEYAGLLAQGARLSASEAIRIAFAEAAESPLSNKENQPSANDQRPPLVNVRN
jgi:predicted ATPase